MKGLLILMFSLSALAQQRVTFENITTTGSGCPVGTVSTILSPDGQTLSLLFDEFRVEVPNYENETPTTNTGRGPNYRPPRQTASIFEHHKTCNITFTATLPAGMTAKAIEVGLQARGNTMLDQGLQGYFSTILVGHRGLANSVGPQVKVIEKKMWTTTRSEVGEDWMTDTKAIIPLRASCASAMNRTIKFELKNHLEARILRNDVTKMGIITVDSNDARGMLSFSLSTAPCR